MSESLVLEHLRHNREQVDHTASDVRDMKERLGIVETHLGNLEVQYASLSNRLDRMDERLVRVERRLDLLPETAG